MFRRFALTLLSSWIVNPLGILIAQWYGVANSPIVILVLLATGACVPFQLLLNECMAASVERGVCAPSKAQLAMVLLMQTAASGWAMWILSVQRFAVVPILLTIAALALHMTLSYLSTLMYYRIVMRNEVSMHAAVVIGAIPGVTSLALYMLFCLTSMRFTQASIFIIATAFLPALVQWGYLRQLYTKASCEVVLRRALPSVATPWLVATAIALAALTAVSTRLREMIASLSVDHVALLLVALNSLLSLINTSTRAVFLSRSGGSLHMAFFVMSMVALGLMALSLSMHWSFTPFFALLVVQAAIVWVIDAARRIPAATPNLSPDSM